MSYSIIRMQKIKSGGVRGIENHDRRITESHTNYDIDKNRSYLNKEIHNPSDSRTYHMRIKERIAELDLSKAVRKDAVVMCEFIATSDKSFFNGISQEDQERFLKSSYEFIAYRYGSENVVHATIHYDEKTPHLHVGIVPITKENRLSCYNIFNRTELRGLQQDYNSFMNEQGFELEKGDSRETKRKHLDTQRFKVETTKEELTDILHEHQNALEEIEEVNSHIKPLEDKKKLLESKIEGLEGEVLTLEQVESIQIKKVLGTKVVRGIDYNEIVDLKKTAQYVNNAINSNNSLNKREEELRRREKQLKTELLNKEKELEIKEKTIKRRSLDEIMKISDLETKLSKYEEVFEKLPEEIREQLLATKKTTREINEYKQMLKNYDIER